MPKADPGPEIGLKVAGKIELPSCVSVTEQPAAGTASFSYDAVAVTSVTMTVGGVLVGAVGVTFTVKVAGARLNVAPVLLLTCDSETVVVPALSGVTVSVCTSPHESKVTEPGVDGGDTRVRRRADRGGEDCLTGQVAAVLAVIVARPDAQLGGPGENCRR